MRRNIRIALAGGLIALVGIVAGAGYLYFKIDSRQQNATFSQGISWRARLYLRKAEGRLPELSWSELLRMTSQKGGFGLADMFKFGQGVNAAVSNPYSSPEDQEAGGRIFRDRCAKCHGLEGGGLLGPPLARFGYTHGDSNAQIYRVLTDGIAGTVMAPTNLPFVERWQVTAYLRTLQLHSAENENRSLKIQVDGEKILRATDSRSEWLSYSGSVNGWRYSALSDITPANVAQLRVRWVYQFSTGETKTEATPLVVNDTIFLTEPPATVTAVDAKTGEVIWKYERPLPAELALCCGKVNRGLAVLNNSLFFGSLDGYLVAIDANTGRVKWQTQVASASDGFSLTGAPLIVDQSVVVGVSGGEFGIRGFIAAYDIATGRQLWRFDTVPGPGEVGHETWANDAWKAGGGPAWATGSYDPALGLIYWGVGNPSPPFSGDGRPGDNLFTDSVVALQAASGKLAWYFQFTPHDEHDWDSAQTPILADLFIDGSERKVICWANRNGFYYVLDRVTGEFLLGTPFVEINWAQGLTPKGRPLLTGAQTVSAGGRVTKPSVGGAVNWQPGAFNPALSTIFLPAVNGASIFTKTPRENLVRGENGFLAGSGGTILSFNHLVLALDAATGRKRWEYRPPKDTGNSGGLLATAEGLVFGASGGYLFALDATSGKELWRVDLGGDTFAPPISFTLGRQQVIAVLAGRAMFVFGL